MVALSLFSERWLLEFPHDSCEEFQSLGNESHAQHVPSKGSLEKGLMRAAVSHTPEIAGLAIRKSSIWQSISTCEYKGTLW